MRYLLSAEEMKNCDSNTISKIGIPEAVLMERAAVCVAMEVMESFPYADNISVVCGTGNNGGDGLCAGRILSEYGKNVSFILVGDIEKCTEETKHQIDIVTRLGYSISRVSGTFSTAGEYLNEIKYLIQSSDVIIDAIFGIGLTRKIEGIQGKVIGFINTASAKVVSVDIPSGISTDSGAVMGTAVKADLTLTFAFMKRGHIFYPGCEYAGKVKVCRMGITEQSFFEFVPSQYIYTESDLTRLPPRKKSGNKGTFGKTLIIAGGRNMSGACEFSAKACYRMGAGLVYVLTDEANREIIQKNVPEAVVTTYLSEEDDNTELDRELSELLKSCKCVCIGPGLGKKEKARHLVEYVLKEHTGIVILDADALNIIAEQEEILHNRNTALQIIMTPHLGELSRLTGMEIDYLKQNLSSVTIDYAEKHKLCLVSKDARTCVSCGFGSAYINTTGNEGMATAGSGDVLAGIISALVAQGIGIKTAAELGTYIHGTAGDRASKKLSSYSVMASDIIDQLPGLLSDIKNSREKQYKPE